MDIYELWDGCSITRQKASGVELNSEGKSDLNPCARNWNQSIAGLGTSKCHKKRVARCFHCRGTAINRSEAYPDLQAV